MTQIAATVASIGGKTTHAGKGHGAKSGAGVDFAAVVAGIGLPEGEGQTAGADALMTDESGTEAGTGEGKAGTPVVLDLALDAAAQSATVDMVVAMQAQVAAPQATAAAPKADEAVVIDGKSVAKPTWRAPKEAISAEVQGKEAKAEVASPAEAAAFAKVAPSSPTKSAAAASPAEAKPALASAEQPAVEPTVNAAATATAAAPSPEAAEQGAKPRAVRTGVQSGAAFRQAAREVAQPVIDTPVATTDKGTTPQVAALLTMPQVMRDPKQAVPTAPAVAVPTDPAQIAVAVEAVVTDGASAPAAATTGRPVLSALHRAIVSASDGRSADPSAAQVVSAPAGRADTDTKDQGQKQDGAASAALPGDGTAVAVSDSTLSASSQFSDILQGLPPLAQSRLGLVGDAAPVVTGPGDVGATLQGQVIDMGVDGQWIDRMAKEITALAEGNGHSRFQLSPPNLGRIQIDVWQGENGGQVKLLTETDEAARRLSDGKTDLQADARLASLSLNSITIERASAGFDGGREQNPQNSQRQQSSGDQQSAQSGAQTGTQTGSQGDGRTPGQSAAQTASQGGSQAGSQGQQNSNGQGKSPWNRDVLNERAGTMAQDGASARRDGDRLVRYA